MEIAPAEAAARATNPEEDTSIAEVLNMTLHHETRLS
jgi:hypothetical protein